MTEEVKLLIDTVARGFAATRPHRDMWVETDAGLESYEDNMMTWSSTMFTALDMIQDEFPTVNSVEFVKNCYAEVPTRFVDITNDQEPA